MGGSSGLLLGMFLSMFGVLVILKLYKIFGLVFVIGMILLYF